MPKTHQYRSTKVEAFDLRLLETTDTMAVPSWVLGAVATLPVAVHPNMLDVDWVVEKPDGSFGFYNDHDFKAEYESLDFKEPT